MSTIIHKNIPIIINKGDNYRFLVADFDIIDVFPLLK
jgi:hypothetical protein